MSSTKFREANPNLEPLVKTHIRYIRHDYFEDDELASGVSPLGRWFFSGLWTCCDKYGRFPWRPSYLGGQLLRYDRNLNAEEFLEELERTGRIVKYSAGDKDYGYCVGWERFQPINKKERESPFSYPDPPKGHVPARASTCADGDVDVEVAVDSAPAGEDKRETTDTHQHQQQQPSIKPANQNPAAVAADVHHQSLSNISEGPSSPPNLPSALLSDNEIFREYQKAYREENLGMELQVEKTTKEHRKEAAKLYRGHRWRIIFAFKAWLETGRDEQYVIKTDGTREERAWPLNDFNLSDHTEDLSIAARLDHVGDAVSRMNGRVLYFVRNLQESQQKSLTIPDIEKLGAFDGAIALPHSTVFKHFGWDGNSDLLEFFRCEEINEDEVPWQVGSDPYGDPDNGVRLLRKFLACSVEDIVELFDAWWRALYKQIASPREEEESEVSADD